MSAAPVLPRPTTISTSEALTRKRFTREEVDRLLDCGFFAGRRYELIDGDWIDKMGPKPTKASAIGLILEWLATFIAIGKIRIQLSLEAAVSDGERSVPERDIARFLAEKKADYEQRHPRGDEVVLVIEVSDTTVAFGLSRKATLYARAGVPEYWVLDLVRRVAPAIRWRSV